MAAVEDQMRAMPVTQLEFYQAMRDFKTMFPEMDEDVIEAVLRANNGAVDVTIDQLLAMNVDLESQQTSSKSPSSSSHHRQEVNIPITFIVFLIIFILLSSVTILIIFFLVIISSASS